MAQFVKKEYRISFILVTLLFALWGFAHSILDVLNKHFQEVMDITRAHSAWVQFMFYLGYFLMAIPAGLYISKKGYRKGVVFGLLLYGLGSLMFLPGEYMMSFPFFLLSLFVIACGLVFLETAANPYMTEMGDKPLGASRLNLAQSFNGLGCICGVLLGGQIIFSDSAHGVSLPYVFMGVIVLAVALVFSRVKLPEIPYQDEDVKESGDASTLKGIFSHPLFVFGLLALFFYEISEISINTFFINYAVDDGLMDKLTASRVLSLGCLVLFMVGRFVGSYLMRFIAAHKLLVICAAGTVLCMILVLLNLGMVSLVALILCYAFEAIMFPTIFALSIMGLGAGTKRASSFLMMSPIGGAVGPLLMGQVADWTSMTVSFVVPLIGFAVVLAYSLKVNKAISGQAPKRNGMPT